VLYRLKLQPLKLFFSIKTAPSSDERIKTGEGIKHLSFHEFSEALLHGRVG
jgi:hypothetical protein